ncbi:GH36-type glycosyl hydrolase domain-containing protein [Candidatus Omnitrophota bacterium]
MTNNPLWKFLDDTGTFVAKNPHEVSRLYFPLANEKGLLSSITPTLHGDIKTGQNTFLTPPVSTEDLSNSRYGRNFWLYIKGHGAWSAASGEVDKSLIEAGMLWHKVIRSNKKIGLKAAFTNFIPADKLAVEIMSVELTNISSKKLTITSTAAIPIYARSADRLRDHRHVSALFNRVRLHKNGIIVKPAMVFDEQGHKINSTSYFVLGCDENGNAPDSSIPTISQFTGEGGNLDKPKAVLDPVRTRCPDNASVQGKETMGAIGFKTVTLLPGRSKRYIIVIGITQEEKPEAIFSKFNSRKKIDAALLANKEFWLKNTSSISSSTGNKDFDRWFRWVMLQPILRKIFGCSFLPDFDYGKGGRGWRDLWQDCLTLLLINPGQARDMLINNFGGCRPDGSNATIIGKKQGEFIPDRNDLRRVWMDHGMWPFMTINLYINQTGDTNILFKKAPFFESKKIADVLNHILRQHERPFTKIGKHGNFLLEGADWNDGLDMASQRGESVAFTAAYAGNLYALGDLLEKIGYKKQTINELRRKADKLVNNIRKNEWIKTKSGYSFFNGYYDNKGKRVEGNKRMTLTGQVFPIMSGVATDKQIKEIYRSAKKYLWDKKLGGFRLNTDFGGVYPDLGRAFGFAYGEKENGSFFSHMNVMFAYALYKRGFAKQGFEVLNSIYKMCMNTSISKIYPGLPEYFNSEGRGMYHYLTGSASWFALTMLTQVFGIRGNMGDLLIDPKLTKEQFVKSTKISIDTNFAGRKIKTTYINPRKLDYGKYKIGKIVINEKITTKPLIKREELLKITSKNFPNAINVYLN